VIDSHCHLNFPSLSNDIENIISRCNINGISKLLTINTNPNNFQDHLSLIQDYDNIFIAYGIHPQEVSNKSQFSIRDIENYITNPKLVAIGETGLDYYYSNKFKQKQIQIFKSHIEASKKFDLPIIIHQRGSEDDIMEILNEYKKDKLKIVFHCFTGSKKLLDFCLKNNYYISLSGIVTFKNANILRDIIKNISMDHLLIETDSPFLAPVPMRGKDNEPSFVRYTANYLANFYSMTIHDFIKQTDNNFYNLFSRVKKDN
jgi:TatD DNase family protein